MKIKDFNLDLTLNETPFFQTQKELRTRFLMNSFEKNPGLLKRLFRFLFEEESKLDCTFIFSYEGDNQKQVEYGNLGRIFKITNCKNEKYWNDELETEVTFSTISGVSSTELYKYILRFVHGNQKDLYICFYNTNLLLYVNSDVLDIITTEQEADILKKEFTHFVDKLYD